MTSTDTRFTHPDDCRCQNCNWNGGRAQPSQPTDADLYALVRNTRSWVMVIAWVVVIQATLAIGFGAIAGFRAASLRSQANATTTPTSLPTPAVNANRYASCMAQGYGATWCSENSR